jgi:hypothetical protein
VLIGRKHGCLSRFAVIICLPARFGAAFPAAVARW